MPVNAGISDVRLPAEWEPVKAVLIAWPHAKTDWNYMLDEVEACYDALALAIIAHSSLVVVTPHVDYVHARLSALGCDMNKVAVVETRTNDTWTRDYGPITTVAPDGSKILNDFCFNGWGMKFAANFDNLVTRRLFLSSVLPGVYRNRLGFVLEGGSIESDGKGMILTTAECLLSPNRNGELTRREIGRYIKKVFGANKVLWLKHGALEGDDTDSHIDTLARFAPDDTIIYTGCQNPADDHYAELAAMRADIRALRTASGNPFNMLELPLPSPIFDDDGQRLPATYANFLILNDAVLMPVYGQEKNDRLAAQIIKIAFPGHEVVPVDCRALIKQHGSLHCATMQLHDINI